MSRWFGLFFLLLIEIGVVIFLGVNHEEKEKQVLSRAMSSLQLSYDAALQARDMAMRLAVQEVVLRHDVLATFAEGVWSKDETEQAQMRGKLYRMLSPTYQRLVSENVLQFQFHTKDGHSYLRFHQPEKFGDDLSILRPSIARVVQTGKPVKGFEIGLLAGGFRFVHPIFLADQRLGSVEISVSFNALRESMTQLLPGSEYAFFVRQSVLKGMSANQYDLYEPSLLRSDYLIEDPSGILPNSPPALSSTFISLEQTIKHQQSVQLAMSNNEQIATYAWADGNWYIVGFLPIRDTESRHVGYVVSAVVSPEMALLERDFWIGLLISTLFILALALFLWRIQRESALRGEQQRRLQTISDTMPDGLYVTNADGVITFINQSALSLLNYEARDVIGHAARDLFYINEYGARGIHAEKCPLCQALRNAQPYSGQWRFMRSDNHVFDVEVASQPMVESGKLTGAVTVFRDVSVRNSEQREIIAARELAEQANAAKSAFLANMSHEIRTPMNGVLGMTALLQETPLNEEQRDYVQTIRSSGDALLTVIDDILDYSKIEAGMMTVESAPMDLRALFKDIQRLMKVRAEQKGLLLSLRVTDAVPSVVLGDVVRVRQILLNLIGNAIKFTDAGSVEVLALLTRRENDRFVIRVEVSDTGIGIAEDKIDRLFKSFSQVDESTTRRFGGTGLGLSISKRLTELMQGEMAATSSAGHGSVFWFTLTVGEAKEEAPKAEIVSDETSRLPSAQILLVEDNLVNQKVATAMLGKLGYKPVIANNGKEAISLLSEHHFDLVFMDCQMPVMDGFEATRAIRAGVTGQPSVCVIALTANAMKEDQDACYAAGMTDYLSKPLQMPALIAMLKKYLVVAHEPKSEQ